MKTITIENLNLEFDIADYDINDLNKENHNKIINRKIEAINKVLEENFTFSQPQIVMTDNTTVKVIELE